MDENRQDLWRWIREHKVQLLLAGISVVAVSAAIFRIKDQETFEGVWKKLKENVSFKRRIISETDAVPEASIVPFKVENEFRGYTRPCFPVSVHQHVRNLPDGRYHSVEKAMEAEALGIYLLPGQTLVDSYTKYFPVA